MKRPINRFYLSPKGSKTYTVTEAAHLGEAAMGDAWVEGKDGVSGAEYAIYSMIPKPVIKIACENGVTYPVRSMVVKDKVVQILYCEFNQFTRRDLYIRAVGVNPKYRNRGWARMTIEGIIEAAKKNGIEQVSIEPHNNSEKFWVKLGFKEREGEKNLYLTL